MSEQKLSTFQTILDFVNELNDVFGKKQKSLALYQRLMSRTQIGDADIIDRHISVFQKFCIENRSGILTRDISKISKISFSDRIFIDLSPIIKNSKDDKDTLHIIWKYLLTISALLDKESDAKKILLSNTFQQEVKDTDVGDILNDMVSTIQNEVEQSGVEMTDNPMQMVGNLMQSGAFEKIMGSFSDKMESGELDVGKLMGLAQTMMGKLTQDMGQNEGMDPMMSGMMMMMQQTMSSQVFVPTLEPIVEEVEDVDDE